MAHNASVEAKSKGSNWTHRQSVQRYGGVQYNATIMIYGQVLLMSETPASSELAEKLTPKQIDLLGTWHGNRIIVTYQTQSNSGQQNPGMTNITQDVKAFGFAYLKHDKVLV